ncbi:MAG: MGMT family protein [Chloroflexota bacterium]
MSDTLRNANLHTRIYAVVQQIPAGKVATYGQVAAIVGRGCNARVVGYAMSALKVDEAETPWQRVINAKGEISIRGGSGPVVQQVMLEKEGVQFNDKNQVDFNDCGWEGPNWSWLEENQFYPAPILKGKKKSPSPGKQASLF